MYAVIFAELQRLALWFLGDFIHIYFYGSLEQFSV
jgi:hypothetical protein